MSEGSVGGWRAQNGGQEGRGVAAPIYVYLRPTSAAVTRAGSTHPTNKHTASPLGPRGERPDLSAALKSSMLMVPTTTLPNLKLLRGGGGAGASAVAGGRAHAKAE